MRIISARNPQAIRFALNILRQGGVVVYPTETAYGLGGDWTKASVRQRIRLIKGREKGKSLSVIVPSLSSAQRYVRFSDIGLRLAKKYWPGSLSLVLPLTAYALRAYRRSTPVAEPSEFAMGQARIKTQISAETLSLRISPHRIAMKLARGLGRPLIATSANVSGNPTLYDAHAIAHVFMRRKHKPDFILDAGKLRHVKPSTVVAIEDGKIKVLREGPIEVRI